MTISALYFAVFSIGLSVLFLNVVRQRIKHKVALGDGGNADLIKAQSVHRNYVETVPFVGLLMAFLEQGGSMPWIIHCFGIAMIVSRLMHMQGIYGVDSIAKGRFFGSVLFNLLLVCGALLLIAQYIF